jgi:trehalose 6-phosphate synthase
MDLSKNVVRGFQAYGRMFERHPEMVGEVTFLAQLQPSRSAVPEYAAYMEAVGRTAEEVNEEHGSASWRPIELFMEDNFPRSVAAYKNFHVLLVNAVRDGMNLVVLEGLVLSEQEPALVLSRETGAADLLGDDALIVNPFDVVGTAEALHQALQLPREERAKRADRMRQAAVGLPPTEWFRAQLDAVDEVGR